MSSVDHKELLNHIKIKREELAQAGIKLKEHFVGLDNVIDKILKNIEVWYVMPSLISRPVIINLWGMTGNGKTDLVRRLVKELNFSDRFEEVQLTNNGSSTSSWHSTISDCLGYSNIKENEAGIILLDEIQRFRTVDEQGCEIHDYKFQDLWMLLSDGKLSSDIIKENIHSKLCRMEYADDSGDDEDEDGNPIAQEVLSDENEKRSSKEKKKRKFKCDYYTASSLKKELRLEESVDEIMQWTREDRRQALKNKLNDHSIYEGRDYTKLLVFIAGNIDEAYKMAAATDSTTIDADIFYAETSKINVLTIKKALRKRFKPEQIARLGNVHVVYRSLSKKSFETIIAKKIETFGKEIKEQFNIDVTFDKSVHEAIYRNGVFPAQGTRPVFSTISSFLETNLPLFMLKAIEENVNNFKIYFKNDHICTDINNFKFKILNEGDIDSIKQAGFNKDKIVLSSVHESGHAVVYAILSGLSPSQIEIDLSSEDRAAFVRPNIHASTKKEMENEITTLLAGRVAEELIFNKEDITTGALYDISQATTVANSYFRENSFGDAVSKTVPIGGGNGKDINYNNNYKWSDCAIEKLLKEKKEQARIILEQNIELLIAVSDVLKEKFSVSKEEFCNICKEHGVNIKIVENGFIHWPELEKSYDKFKAKLSEGISI